MNPKKKPNRALAFFLCAVMLVSIFAAPAYAAEVTVENATQAETNASSDASSSVETPDAASSNSEDPSATSETPAEESSSSSAAEEPAAEEGTDPVMEEAPAVNDTATDEDYILTFEDAESRGDWQTDLVATTGWNGVSIDGGALTVSAGPTGDANLINGNTFASDRVAPAIENGFIETELTDVGTGGRIGVFFRYTSADQSIGLLYDADGSWDLRINGTDTDLGNLATLTKGQTYIFRVEYVGTQIRATLDGKEILNKTFPGVDIGAGRIGLRAWGYSTQLGAVKVDNLTYGQQAAIEGGDGGDPDPEQPGWTTGPDGLIDYTLSTSATSNWIQAHGESSLVSEGGALVMTTADGNENKYNPQYALMMDDASPALNSGELTAVIENNAAGRFCLVFRYQDKENYAAVGYDWGNWVIKTRVNGKEVTENFTGPDTRGNGEHTVKVAFWDNSVQVDVDGETLYSSSSFLTGVPAEGKLGLRTWGYAGNYAQIKVKSLTYNQTPSPEFDEDGNYMVTFTDSMHRGGWQQDAAAFTGWNGLSFTDGEGDAGYMTVSAGPSNQQAFTDGNTLFSDLRAPVIDNGFVEMDLTDVGAGGRIGVFFRYTSPDQHVGLMYDTGTWQLRVNNKDVSQLGTYTLNKGQTYHLRIEYVGNNVRLLIDGNEVFDKTLDSVDIGAGRIGLRVWGYSQSGANFLGAAKVDNVVNGEFNAVMLDPDQIFLTRSEQPYDLAIGLSQTANAFTGIKVGDTELVNGKDYAYTEGSNVVTLTKSYLAACQAEGESRTLSFVFEDGYIAYFTLNVQGEDEENIHYYRSFADGIENVEQVTGTAGTISDEGDAIRFTGAQNGAIFLDSNSPVLRNAEVEFTFDPMNDNGNVAAVLRYAGPDDWLAVGIGGVGGNHTQWYAYTPTGTYALFDNNNDLITENGGNSTGDGQRLYSGRAKPYTLKVRVVESTITVWVDGSEVLQTTIYGLPDSAGQAGLWLNSGAGATVYDMTVNTSNLLAPYGEKVKTDTISSNEMTVTLDAEFPRVVSYELDGKTMAGQAVPYHALEINNILCSKVEVTKATFDGSTATYSLKGSLKEDGATKTLGMDVVFTVKDNTLTMEIQNADTAVNSVNFPNQSLVSVSSDQAGAALRESNYTKEHTYNLTTRSASPNHKYTSLAVINNSELAAAVRGGTFKNRGEICYQTVRSGSNTSTGLWPNEYILRGLNGEELEGNNIARVAITADRNSDNKVDYQDGAVALRDDIPSTILNNSSVANAYTSIAVNEASWAQYPFLTALDNIKKMSLGTDNFPQLVVYKGYQSQGHDSAHPNFADINEQAGGVEDFQTLTEKAAQYNAVVGVHINETEVYPEAPQFGVLASSHPGWFWFDQANQMIRENDILDGVIVPDGNMFERLDDMDEAAGGDLGFVYVDTYFDNRWPAYTLATTLNEHGWPMGTEYIDELSSFTVWAHHIGSEYNNAGNLVRFVDSGLKDIFGYSNLFRGPTARHTAGIFGWQADPAYGQNYQNTLEDFYTRILPNKYLSNFPIMQWESDTKAVLGEDLNVVTEVVNGTNKITVDGRVIANGNNLFIPWDPDTEEKIYHWNQNGGTSDWQLPESWAGEKTVTVYRLSDEGRTEETTVEVKDGWITLNADPKTPYVVYKGSNTAVAETDLTEYNWTEGGNLADAGFDSHTWGYAWDVSSTSGSTDHIVYSNENGTVIGQGDTNALIGGKADGTLHQTITGLEGGKSYAVSVYTDTSDGRRATLTVVTPDGGVYTQYTDGGNAVYGGSHSSKKGSGYERLEVQITLPAGATTAELYLTAAAGSDSDYTRFDDVRVYELDAAPDAKGHYYFDDFEDFAVGFGLFQNGISGSNHMSETSEFTNDTIDGRYSLKIQELGLGSAYTTPSTLRLPANTEVTVSLDYLVSNGGGYTLTAKEADGSVLGSVALEATGMGAANAKTAKLTFTTGASGKAYLELTRAGGTVILDNVTVDIDKTSTDAQVKIQAQASEGGSVKVDKTALLGSDVVVTITPNAGYHVAGITVNGMVYPASLSLTLYNVQSDLDVQVTFEKDNTPVDPNPTPEVTPNPGTTPAPGATPTPTPAITATPAPTKAPAAGTGSTATPAPTEKPDTEEGETAVEATPAPSEDTGASSGDTEELPSEQTPAASSESGSSWLLWVVIAVAVCAALVLVVIFRKRRSDAE